MSLYLSAGPYTIHHGKGVTTCKLGQTTEQVFHFTKHLDRHGKWIDLCHYGIQLVVEEDKVQCIVFYFRDRKHWTFDGVTSKGIGFLSSIPDTLRAYGPPDFIGDTIQSQFGTFPGVHHCAIHYPRYGIDFNFYDNQLADIRVYKKILKHQRIQNQ